MSSRSRSSTGRDLERKSNNGTQRDEVQKVSVRSLRHESVPSIHQQNNWKEKSLTRFSFPFKKWGRTLRIASGIRQRFSWTWTEPIEKGSSSFERILEIRPLAIHVLSFLPMQGFGSPLMVVSHLCMTSVIVATERIAVAVHAPSKVVKRMLHRFVLSPWCRLRSIESIDLSLDKFPQELYVLLEQSLEELTLKFQFELAGFVTDDSEEGSDSQRPLATTRVMRLERLDLGSELPQNLTYETAARLKNLKHLTMSIIDYVPEWLGTTMYNLEELHIRDANLRTFPKSIGSLQKLRNLELYSNREWFRIPEWLGKDLKNLQVLKLTDCGLINLPSHIEDYSNLAVLDLSDNLNTLQMLPDWQGQTLPSLEQFSIRHCGIELTVTSQWFHSLSNVRNLNLFGNMSLTLLPEWFGVRFQFIEQLNLACCGLSEWPVVLSKLRMLRILILDSNDGIESLPQWVKLSNPNLEVLSVASTALSPQQSPFAGFEGIMGHPKLYDLNLAHCSNFREFPVEFVPSFPCLQKLCTSSCGLLEFRNSEMVPHDGADDGGVDEAVNTATLETGNMPSQSPNTKVKQVSTLKELELSANDFSKNGSVTFLQSFSNVQYLSMARCNLTAIPRSILHLVNLERLVLSDNSFPSKASRLDGILDFKFLKELEMERCSLTEIPIFTRNGRSLKHLDLAENDIECLPRSFVKSYSFLTLLDLTGNKISKLPSNFSELRELKKANLMGNPLTSLPKNLNCMVSLNMLGLSVKRMNKASIKQLRAFEQTQPRCVVVDMDNYHK